MLGFTLRRVRTHRLLFAAALLTVVLTTCALATLAVFTAAVGDAGLRQVLRHQQASRTTIDVYATTGATGRDALDRSVRSAAKGAYGDLPTRIRSSTRSGPYGLPPNPHTGHKAAPSAAAGDGTASDLTLFATFDASHVTVVRGSMPGPVTRGTGTVPVAFPEQAARSLGLRPGSRLTLTDRLGGPPVRVVVTGTFRPADPTSVYWRLDPVGGRGVLTSDGFTTYGPLLADPSTFDSGRVAPAEMSWQTTADFRTLTTGGIARLTDHVRQAVTRISHTSADGTAQASSGLPGLLTELRRTELVGRSTLLVDALQLVVLAAVSLWQVAGLLAGERAGETALLRARGASRRRVAGLAAGESLLVAVPAALVAPPLTGPLVGWLAGHGATAATGAALGGSGFGAATAWQVAACTALACALAVILPTLRRQGTHVSERAARLRAGALPAAVRGGADVALLVVAGVAYWRLRGETSGGGALSFDSGGRLGVDPVLVAAPALCVLAGTVVALRLLPLAARLVERRAARGRGLVTALAGWQFSRRPRRGTAPALLLVLAVAMGVFAIGQNASWQRSQRDQADFTVGTDIRVTDTSLPVFGQGGVYDALRARHLGVTSVAPANRSTTVLPGNKTATILATDTKAAATSLHLRPDLATQPLSTLLRPLYTAPDGRGDRDTGGFVVPGDSTALRLTVRLESLDAQGKDLPGGTPESLNVTLKDRYGVAYAFFLTDLPADGRDHVLAVDLAAAEGTGAPAGPLRLTGVEGDHPVQPHNERHRLTVSAVRTVAADGTVRAVPLPRDPADRSWRAASGIDDPNFLSTAPGYLAPDADAARSTSAVPLSVTYDTGAEPLAGSAGSANTGEVTLNVAAPPPPPLDAVATDAFLRATGAAVGGQVRVQLAGTTFDVRVTGAVRALPTSAPSDTAGAVDRGDDVAADSPTSTGDDDAGALLLDLRAVNRTLDAAHAFALEPTEWWLGTAPGTQARVVAALRADRTVNAFVSRDQTLSDLRSDPLGAGPQSVLPALVLAAAVLAAVGFTVSAMGALRERAAELALLRALGMSRTRVARMVAAEQGLLALVALAVGVLLGIVFTHLVVPLVVLTTRAGPPVPALVVVVPPAPFAGMLALVLTGPLVVIVATALRRGDATSALRQQGEA